MSDPVVVPTIQTLPTIEPKLSGAQPKYPFMAKYFPTWTEETLDGAYEGRETGLAYLGCHLHGTYGVIHRSPGAEVLAHISGVSVPLNLSLLTVVGDLSAANINVNVCAKQIDRYWSKRHIEVFGSLFWDERNWSGVMREKRQTWETYTSTRQSAVVTLTTTLKEIYTESVSVMRIGQDGYQDDELLKRSLSPSAEVIDIMTRIIKTDTVADQTVEAVFPLQASVAVDENTKEQLQALQLMPRNLESKQNRNANNEQEVGEQENLLNAADESSQSWSYAPTFAENENWTSLGIPSLVSSELAKAEFAKDAQNLHIRQVSLTSSHLEVWRSCKADGVANKVDFHQVHVQNIQQYTVWGKNHSTYVSEKASYQVFFGTSPTDNTYSFNMTTEGGGNNKSPVVSHVLKDKANFAIELPHKDSVFEIQFGTEKQKASLIMKNDSIEAIASQMRIQSEQNTTFKAGQSITIHGQNGKNVRYTLGASDGLAMLEIS